MQDLKQESIIGSEECGYSAIPTEDGFGIHLKIWDGKSSGEFTLTYGVTSSLWGTLRHIIDSGNMRDKDRARYLWQNWIVKRVSQETIDYLVSQGGREMALAALWLKAIGEIPKPIELEVLLQLYDASKEGDGAG